MTTKKNLRNLTILVMMLTLAPGAAQAQDKLPSGQVGREIGRLLDATLAEIRADLEKPESTPDDIYEQLKAEKQSLTRLRQLLEIRAEGEKIAKHSRALELEQKRLNHRLQKELAEVKRLRRKLLSEYGERITKQRIPSIRAQGTFDAIPERRTSFRATPLFQPNQSANLAAPTGNWNPPNQIKRLKPANPPLQYGLLLRFVMNCGCTGEIYRQHDGQFCLHHHHRNRPMTTHKLTVWSAQLPIGAVRVSVLADGKTVFWTKSDGYSIATALQRGS